MIFVSPSRSLNVEHWEINKNKSYNRKMSSQFIPLIKSIYNLNFLIRDLCKTVNREVLFQTFF